MVGVVVFGSTTSGEVGFGVRDDILARLTTGSKSLSSSASSGWLLPMKNSALSAAVSCFFTAFRWRRCVLVFTVTGAVVATGDLVWVAKTKVNIEIIVAYSLIKIDFNVQVLGFFDDIGDDMMTPHAKHSIVFFRLGKYSDKSVHTLHVIVFFLSLSVWTPLIRSSIYDTKLAGWETVRALALFPF